jgi:hypothetical protein
MNFHTDIVSDVAGFCSGLPSHTRPAQLHLSLRRSCHPTSQRTPQRAAQTATATA